MKKSQTFPVKLAQAARYWLLALLPLQLLCQIAAWTPMIAPAAAAQTSPLQTQPNQSVGPFDMLLIIDESGSMWSDTDPEPPTDQKSGGGNPLPSGDGSNRIVSARQLIDLLNLEGLKNTRIGILLFSDDVTLLTPNNLVNGKPYQIINRDQDLNSLNCTSPIFADISSEDVNKGASARQALKEALKTAHQDYLLQKRNTWTDTARALKVAERVFKAGNSCRPNPGKKVAILLTDGVPETSQLPSNGGANQAWKDQYLPTVWSELAAFTARTSPDPTSLFTMLVTTDAITKQKLGLPETAENPWQKAVKDSFDPVPPPAGRCQSRYLFVPSAAEIPLAFYSLNSCFVAYDIAPPQKIEPGQTKTITFESNYAEVTLEIRKSDPKSVVTIKRPVVEGGPAVQVVAQDDSVLFETGHFPTIDPYYQAYRFIFFDSAKTPGYVWHGQWSVTADNTAAITYTTLIKRTGLDFGFVSPKPEVASWQAGRPMPIVVQVMKSDGGGNNKQADTRPNLVKNVTAKLVLLDKNGNEDSAFNSAAYTLKLQPDTSGILYVAADGKPLPIPKNADDQQKYQIQVTAENDKLDQNETLNITRKNFVLSPGYWINVVEPQPKASIAGDKLHVRTQLMYGGDQVPAGNSLSSGRSIKATLVGADGKPGAAQPCNGMADGKDFDCNLVSLTQPVAPGNYTVQLQLYDDKGPVEFSDENLPVTVTAGAAVIINPPITTPIIVTQPALGPTTTLAPTTPTTVAVTTPVAITTATPPPPPPPPTEESDLTWLGVLLGILLLVAIIAGVFLLLPRLNPLKGLSYRTSLNSAIGSTKLTGNNYKLPLNYQDSQGQGFQGGSLQISADQPKPKSIKLRLLSNPGGVQVRADGNVLGNASYTSPNRETLVTIGNTSYTITNPYVKGSSPQLQPVGSNMGWQDPNATQGPGNLFGNNGNQNGMNNGILTNQPTQDLNGYNNGAGATTNPGWMPPTNNNQPYNGSNGYPPPNQPYNGNNGYPPPPNPYNGGGNAGPAQETEPSPRPGDIFGGGRNP